MNQDSIRHSLQAFNPRLGEIEDADWQTLFKQAKEAPELQTFLAQEAEFDQIFAAKLKGIKPTEALRKKCLNPENTIPPSDELSHKQKHIISFPFSQKISSLAAALLMILALGSILFRSPVNALPNQKLEAIRNYATQYSKNPYGVIPGNGLVQLTQILSNAESPIPHKLPTSLKNLEGIACQYITIEGVKISLICFRGDTIYHLFVANRSDFPKQRDIDRYQEENKGRYSHIWSTEDQLFILVSDQPLT